MSRLKLDILLGTEQLMATDGIPDLLDDLRIEDFVNLLNETLNNFDYSTRDMIKDENTCRSVFQLLLSGTRLSLTPERHYVLGRSDLEATSAKHHWVFELKYHRDGGKSVDVLLKEAKEQVVSRRYGERPYLPPLKRLALVFSEKDHRFVAWDWAD